MEKGFGLRTKKARSFPGVCCPIFSFFYISRGFLSGGVFHCFLLITLFFLSGIFFLLDILIIGSYKYLLVSLSFTGVYWLFFFLFFLVSINQPNVLPSKHASHARDLAMVPLRVFYYSWYDRWKRGMERPVEERSKTGNPNNHFQQNERFSSYLLFKISFIMTLAPFPSLSLQSLSFFLPLFRPLLPWTFPFTAPPSLWHRGIEQIGWIPFYSILTCCIAHPLGKGSSSWH